jgi:hypothetical protein
MEEENLFFDCLKKPSDGEIPVRLRDLRIQADAGNFLSLESFDEDLDEDNDSRIYSRTKQA